MVIGVVPKSITAVNRQSGLTDGLFQVTTPYFYDPLKGAVLPVGTVTRANSLRGLLYNFDGTSYLRYANEEKITPPFTVAFDVIFQTVGFDLFQPIVAQGGVGSTFGFKVAIASNGIRVTFGGVADYFISNSTSANVPYRVCVTVSGNGGTAIAYKNGASVGSVAVGTMLTPAGSGTRIGADATAQVFSGTRIGNVALWNRALSASEVLLLNNTNLISSQPRYVHTDSTLSPTSRTFFIPRKKVMTSQPQGSSVAINWDNPITRNLTIAYLPTYRFPVQDIVTGILATGSTQFTPRPGTGAIVGANSGAVRPYVDFDTTGKLGPNGVNGYNISIFALFEQYDTTTGGLIWGGGNSAGVHARFEKNTDGSISFRPNSNTAGSQVTGPVLGVNRVYALGGVGIGFSREFFIDGNSVASANNSITLNNNVFTFAGTYNTSPSTTNFMAGGIYCAYIWSRALTGAEVKSISDNPWQIFKQFRLGPALAEEGKVYAPFMS